MLSVNYKLKKSKMHAAENAICDCEKKSILYQRRQSNWEFYISIATRIMWNMHQQQGDCRKEPRRDPLCTKTKTNQNS